MEIYEHLIKPKEDPLKYFSRDNICFLDIETTGLSRKFNKIYLIGLLYFNTESESWTLTQLFANHIDNEDKLLKKLNDYIRKFDLIITYNGDSFDLPFINNRCEIHKIENSILDKDSFDIYRKIRTYSPYLNFENLKLKTIEENLGIYREDKYSGKDCIDFYYQYMESKDIMLKEKILQHNYDDLYYLLDIVKIFDLIKNIKSTSINYKGETIYTEIENIIEQGDIFSISCNVSMTNQATSIIYFEENFNLNWQRDALTVNLETKEALITPTKKCLFIDTTIWPSDTGLKDMSSYIVPNNIILLKVENKYEVENIKNVIKSLVLYVK